MFILEMMLPFRAKPMLKLDQFEVFRGRLPCDFADSLNRRAIGHTHSAFYFLTFIYLCITVIKICFLSGRQQRQPPRSKLPTGNLMFCWRFGSCNKAVSKANLITVLASFDANVKPKQLPSYHLEEIPMPYPLPISIQYNCGWSKETQTSQSIYFPFSVAGWYLSAARPDWLNKLVTDRMLPYLVCCIFWFPSLIHHLFLTSSFK